MRAAAGQPRGRAASHPGLTLELTVPADYPASLVRVLATTAHDGTALPSAHRDAISALAQDFLTNESVDATSDGLEMVTKAADARRPSLRAMVDYPVQIFRMHSTRA